MKLNIVVLNILFLLLFQSIASASKPKDSMLAEKIASAKVAKEIIKDGDTLVSLLQRAGFSQQNISAVMQENILPKNFKIIAKDFYLSVKAKAFQAIKFIDPYRETTYFFWSQGDNAGTKKLPGNFRREIRTVGGEVNGSLIESISQLTGNDLVAYRFMDAYNLEGKVARRLRKGARFSLTYEKLYSGDIFVRDGEVLQTSLEIDGETRNRSFVQFDDGGVFVSDRDRLKNRPLYAPVAYISISSHFNPKRLHPIRKRRQPHWGTDFVLAPGSPIFSAEKGKVANLGKTRAGGFFIRISHPGGFETTYNHLASLNTELSIGDSVRAGQTIGSVGCTGYCTKPHLHFQVKLKKKVVDPAKYIRDYPFHYEKRVASFVKDNKSSLARDLAMGQANPVE